MYLIMFLFRLFIFEMRSCQAVQDGLSQPLGSGALPPQPFLSVTTSTHVSSLRVDFFESSQIDSFVRYRILSCTFFLTAARQCHYSLARGCRF